MGKTYFRLPNIHHVWLWNIVRFWALSTPLALLPPTPFVTLENYCHDHNYYCHVALTLLLSCVCAQHFTKLDAVHELPLCSNCSKFCLEVALSWYELEIWMAVWTQRQMAEPPGNVWPAHGCYLFSLSSSQQTHCDCTAAVVRFTSRAFQDYGAVNSRGYLDRLSPIKEAKNLFIFWEQDIWGKVTSEWGHILISKRDLRAKFLLPV